MGAWLVGRLDQLPAFAARALVIDPMNVQLLVNSQYSAILRRDYRSAVQFGARVLAVDPNNEFGLGNNATAYFFLGQIDSALVTACRCAAHGRYGNDVLLAMLLAAAGQWTAVDSIRAVVTARAAHTNAPHSERLYLVPADGDTERAIDEFGRGLDAHEPVFLTTAIGCDPFLNRFSAGGDTRMINFRSGVVNFTACCTTLRPMPRTSSATRSAGSRPRSASTQRSHSANPCARSASPRCGRDFRIAQFWNSSR